MKKVNPSLNIAETTLIEKTFPGYNYTPTTKGQALGRMAAVDWQNTVSSLQKGGLLKAQYGKGTYIYTGYAFFRQLPAGVPGAIRLYVNLLSQSSVISRQASTR